MTTFRLPFALVLLTAFCLALLDASAAPTITATQDDGVPAATRKLVGDTITYTTTISNTAAVIVGSTANDATSVMLTNATPANTTDTGTVTISPIAFDDVYPQTIIGNTSINSANIPYSVFSNDFAGTPATTTIAAFDATSLHGGTVVMVTSGANIGQFTYNPPRGYEGADSFTYTLTNALGSSVGTVNLNVSGMVWFINNNAGACSSSCDGRLSNPYTTLAAFNTANGLSGGLDPDTNDNIFIYESATGYSGAVTLRTGQKLIGQDATASLATITGLTPSTGSAAFPVMNSGNGTITNLASTVTLNTNATVRGLSINSTTSTGMNDPAGAITGVNVSEVAVTTTTGTAVLLSDVAGTISLRSVSASGATNGISLTNLTSGSFTVTGDGGSSNNGSGGTIQNTTGHGVTLANAVSVSLGYMNITNPGLTGVQAAPVGWVFPNTPSGLGVNTITVNRCNLSDNAGNNTADDGLRLENAGGAIAVTNCSITGSRHQGITLDNFSQNVASFAIQGTTVSGSTGGDGVLLQVRGTSVMTTGAIGGGTAALGNTFSNNTSTGLQVTAGDTGNIASMNIQNNTVTGNNAGMDLDLSQNSSMNLTVQNNAFTNQHTQVLNMVQSTSSTAGTLSVLIKNNTIGTQGVLDSGSQIGSGIRVANGAVNVNVTIDSNTIREIPNASGIELGAQAYSVTGNVKYKIVNNTIVKPSGTNQGLCGPPNQTCPNSQVFILSDSNAMGGFDHVCTAISGNTVYDPSSLPNGAGNAAFYFARRTSASNTLNLEGTQANARNQILATNTITNPGPSPSSSDVIDENTSGTVAIVAAGTCGAFPLLFAPSVEISIPQVCADTLTDIKPAPTSSNGPAASVHIPKLPARLGAVTSELQQADLDRLISVARERWESTGLTSEQLVALRAMKLEVSDLPNERLGQADASVIRVAARGAGHGWFIGSANDDRLFSKSISTTRSYTEPTNTLAGQVDLLTAIMHEMGHALGLPDSYEGKDRDSLMYGYLTSGERRVPAKGQAIGAVPGSLSATPHFLGSPVNIGTLPPGKSVIIKFSVTIGPISGNPQQTSSQGTVSGNFTSVLTDDPTVGGATDPTVTLFGIAPAFTSTNATTFTVGTNGNFSVAANGAPPPTFSTSGLPSNVTLSSAGVLSGIPAAGTGGVYNITITAANGIGSNAMQSFTLTVNQAPAITSANNTTFTVGSAGTFTVTKTGFPAPTLTETGTLPSGVTFTAATGVLAGTPDPGTGGSYPISFKAANGIGSDAVQSFTLTVNQAPAITSANTTTFTAGTPGTFNVIATGFPSPAINLTSGSLPSGVNFGTGTLAGTPAANAFGTYALQFTASNGVGSNAVQSFSLVVNPNAQDVKSKPSITKSGVGVFHVAFIGNPGTQYTIQFAPTLPVLPAVPNWQTLGLRTAASDGTFFIIDTPGATMRFYRAIIP